MLAQLQDRLGPRIGLNRAGADGNNGKSVERVVAQGDDRCTMRVVMSFIMMPFLLFLVAGIVKFCPAEGAEFFFARKEQDTEKFPAERTPLREDSNYDPRQQKCKSKLKQRMQPISAAFPSALRQQDDTDIQEHCADPISDFLFFELHSGFLLFPQYRREFRHHGKRRTVAPIAHTPDKTVDRDLAGAAADEIHAVIAMIQINVDPITSMIAFHIVRACQRPEGTMAGVARKGIP